MTTANIPFCTDEELLDELKKLGYSDVSSDVFEMMKDDLSNLVSKEQFDPKSSIIRSGKESASTGLKYRYPRNKNSITIQHFHKTPEKILETGQSESANNHENQFSDKGTALTGLDYRYPPNRFLRTPKVFSEPEKTEPSEAVTNYEDTISSGLSSNSDATNISPSFDKYKGIFKNYKKNSYSRKLEILSTEPSDDQENLSAEHIHDISSDFGSSSSSVPIGTNKIKRKVLRHRDGKPVITEEFLDLPSIFNSSYPETQTLDNSKSFSSDDLSWKSNSSTGSTSAISPDAGNTPRSTLSSTRSLQSRFMNPRKKKSDPVAMYNYYKKFWNEFKPPGEKTHDKIRWAVRDKMLDYHL